MGGYQQEEVGRDRWFYEDHEYSEGEWYGMTYQKIHSIYFSAGAKVLFFEGPERSPESRILEPVCDGCRVPTFRVQDWMFEKGAA